MKSFLTMSEAELTKHIKKTSKNTSLVIVTNHASARMRARKVLLHEVFHCMQNGRLLQPAEPDLKTGNPICRMECYGASRNLVVCIALSDDAPNLIVVTVIEKK